MRGSRRTRARAGLPRTFAALAALALVLVVTACTGAPPPVVGEVPPAPAPQFEPDPTELRIGVDDLGVGFNPHRIADTSPTSRAMAALVLPSAFRPGPDGSPRLDTTVVTSARVTSTAPYTVSYEIAPAASWSDNAPVAAEDFVYLWQQMRSQPGVVGAAGYRAISDVRSRAGGKAVDVVFDRPYPAWSTLFDHLLPAHLLKDAPGSWGGALTDSIPLSAGPYAVRVVDRIRGQITLARNDRYWGTPAVPDEVVLQAADAPSLIERVRSGDVQATQFRADARDMAALAVVGPSLTVRTVPEPAVVQLALRSDDGPLGDIRVRRAVAAALDRGALRRAGTAGGPGSTLPADAFARAPSEPGYRSTLPADSPAAGQDLATTASLLTQAGYVRGADGSWERDGRPLSLHLAAPAQVAPFGRLLDTLGAELRAAGIESTVVADGGVDGFPPGRGPSPSTSVPTPAPPTTAMPPPRTTTAGTPPTSPRSPRSPTTSSTVPPTPDSASDLAVADISVLALPVGEDPISDLSSVVGCPSGRVPSSSGTIGPTSNSTSTAPGRQPGAAPPPTTAPPPPTTTTTAPTTTLVGPPVPTSTVAPTSTTTSTTTGAPTQDDTEPEVSEALSPTGFCDPALQSLLDAAMSGAVSTDTALALAEPTLWSSLPTIPLFQAASVLAGPAVRTDVVVGPLPSSPFAGADRWVPPPATERGDDGIN